MATLRIDAVADVSAARGDIDALGASFRDLGDDARAAGDDARQSGADFDALGAGADDVASKSSQAAGAMGDLAGGLDLVGATGAATALEGVAIATQVAAGAGDVLNLVAETSVGRWIANTAAMVAHRTASIVGAAATAVMTGAQAALNAVMAANPIALVVIAIVALVAGLILAYKHSETFRNIVDAAFRVARAGIEAVIDVIKTVIDWFGRLPAEARAAWDKVSGAIGDAVDDGIKFVTNLIDDVKRLSNNAVGAVAGAFSSMFQPIRTAIDWVQDLIDKIKGIDFPDFPDVNPFGRASTVPGGPGSSSTLNVTLLAQQSPLDPEQTMKDLFDALREYSLRRGYELTLTEVVL